jgi:hypothetical protein
MGKRFSSDIQVEILTIREVRLPDDGSNLWAWQMLGPHADSRGMIHQQFAERLRNASAEEAAEIISTLLKKNRLAILWATLLRVAAERPDIYADRLWNLATNEKVLLSHPLRTDAINAVAAFYPSRSQEERRALERAAFKFGAEDQFHQMEHEQWLARLFQAIGADKLETEEARSFLETDEGSIPVPNEHSAPMVTVSEFTQRQQLHRAGVDFEVPENDKLQSKSEDVKKQVGLLHGAGSKIEDMQLAL